MAEIQKHTLEICHAQKLTGDRKIGRMRVWGSHWCVPSKRRRLQWVDRHGRWELWTSNCGPVRGVRRREGVRRMQLGVEILAVTPSGYRTDDEGDRTWPGWWMTTAGSRTPYAWPALFRRRADSGGQRTCSSASWFLWWCWLALG
jgi:hypothetical protein